MSLTVQSPSLIPNHAQEFGVGSWVKNSLFGRVGDWKNNLLMAGTAFWVVKAAFSFFSGAWTLAIVELFTSGFLSTIRKDYLSFTNLHKATGVLHKENADFKQSNIALKQTHNYFKKTVEELSAEREKFEGENAKFAMSNTAYKKHLGTMERTLDRAVGEISSASRRGRNVSKKVLKNALQTFSQQKKLIDRMESEIFSKQTAAQKEWAEVVKKVGNTSLEGVKHLEKAKDDLAEVVAKVAAHKRSVEHLEREIKHLERVRGRFESSADRHDRSADRIERLVSIWQSLLKLENGKGPGVALTVAAITWAVAKRYYEAT